MGDEGEPRAVRRRAVPRPRGRTRPSTRAEAARPRYLDKMEQDKKEAAAEKSQHMEAKKIAATARKEKLRLRETTNAI